MSVIQIRGDSPREEVLARIASRPGKSACSSTQVVRDLRDQRSAVPSR